MQWFKKAWRGEEKLNKVFWVYGFLYPTLLLIVASLLLIIASVFSGIKHFSPLYLGWWVLFLTTIAQLLIIIPYSIWVNVSLWKCAFNCDKKIWGYLARIFSALVLFEILINILSIPNAIYVLTADSTEPLARMFCEQEMTKTAQKVFENPREFIKTHSSDLRQCIQGMLVKESQHLDMIHNPTTSLSIDEQIAIRDQFMKCWNVPEKARNTKNVVELHIELLKNGSVANVVFLDNKENDNSNPLLRVVADSAIQAVHSCSPLKNMPVDKFNDWKVMELTFDPREMP